MNSCLQCGKEIPEGRKFCCSSCSAKYNNVRRERKPWTEEQKQKFSQKQTKVVRHPGICCICGKEIASDRHHYCVDCRTKYGSTVPVLKKLGCWTGHVENDLRCAEDLLKFRYFDQKESLLSIAKDYSISKDTVRWYLRRSGQKLRDLSESTKVSVEEGRQQVGGSPQFKSGTHTSWEGKKFHFRSSWEERYMQELDKKRISYLYEPFSLRYFDTQKNEERVAIPDFFFPDTNTIVELKSSYTYDEQNMKDKANSYKQRGYAVKLLLNWKEIDL